MKDKKLLKYGIMGGILASMCCWGPLILVSLGLVSASGALSIGYRSPWFLGIGGLFTLGIVAYYLRKQSCCKTKQSPWKTFGVTLGIILIMVATTLFLKDIVAPWFAAYVYR